MDALTSRATLKRISAAMSRYGLVGIICATMNLIIIYIGNEICGYHYAVAALGTCLITIPASYFLHRQFTFGLSSRADLLEFRRFCVTQLSQFLTGLVMLAAIVELSNWTVIIAMLLVTAIQFVYGFAMSSTWVFGFVCRNDTTKNAGTCSKH